MLKRTSLPAASGTSGHNGGSTIRACCGRLEPALLGLHQATELNAWWKTLIRLLECAVPCQHLMADLPCEGTPATPMMTTLPHDGGKAVRLRNHAAAPPMLDLLTGDTGIKLLDPDVHRTARQLTQSRFHREVMAPNGLRHAVALLFWEGDRLCAQVGVCRTAVQGRFSDGEKRLLLALYPHIEAALRRVVLIARQELVSSLLREALEHPSDGLVLLDAQGRMAFQNHAAALACAIWKDGEAAAAIQWSAGKVVAPPICLLEKARDLLARYTEDRRNKSLLGGCYEGEMCHQDGERVGARVRVVVPKRRQAPPHVRIEFSRPLKSIPARMPGLPVYRLSDCEHRVALLVARGLRNQGVAAELGLSVNTVRAHLREIFSKLGVERRGELAAVLGAAGLDEPDFSV